MIDSLLVRFFQCHDRRSVELAPTVTTFVGPSAAGKSALLRALRWLCTNRPLGAEFVGRWGEAKYTSVESSIDGRLVRRKRSASANRYEIDGKKFKALRTGVPQAVADLVNVGPVNFQFQFDAPYWFTLPPSQVSAALNDIINLGRIDASLAEAARRVRAAKAAADVSADRLRTSTIERDRLRYAVEMAADVDRLTSVITRCRAVAIKSRRINDLVSGMSRAVQDQDRAVALAQIAGKCVAKEIAARAAGDRARKLSDLVSAARSARAILDAPVPNLDRLVELRTAAKRAADRHRKLSVYLFAMQNTQWEIDQCEKEIRSHRKTLAIYGSRCPRCGQPIRPSR